jgi:hypothetical protein
MGDFAFTYFTQTGMRKLNTYLYYMMTKLYLSDTEYLNIAHDGGEEGLRYFKSHLTVYEKRHKYICTFARPGKKEL